nr:hypothetical protein [Bradyrhizobium genosp. SA-3]
MKLGDHVIPLFTPDCRQRKSCPARRPLCTTILTCKARRNARRYLPLHLQRQADLSLQGLLAPLKRGC